MATNARPLPRAQGQSVQIQAATPQWRVQIFTHQLGSLGTLAGTHEQRNEIQWPWMQPSNNCLIVGPGEAPGRVQYATTFPPNHVHFTIARGENSPPTTPPEPSASWFTMSTSTSPSPMLAIASCAGKFFMWFGHSWCRYALFASPLLPLLLNPRHFLAWPATPCLRRPITAGWGSSFLRPLPHRHWTHEHGKNSQKSHLQRCRFTVIKTFFPFFPEIQNSKVISTSRFNDSSTLLRFFRCQIRTLRSNQPER